MESKAKMIEMPVVRPSQCQALSSENLKKLFKNFIKDKCQMGEFVSMETMNP